MANTHTGHLGRVDAVLSRHRLGATLLRSLSMWQTVQRFAPRPPIQKCSPLHSAFVHGTR